MPSVSPSPAAPSLWLSILIPVYNVEAYLAECVESVIQQADANAGVEILLLDDCSTDSSATVMQKLETRWPGRLHLLRHSHNQGISVARNTMIEAAQGEYLWFLDSDDKLLSGAIPGLRAIIQQHHPDMVLCDFQVWPSLRRRELHRSSFLGPARTCSNDTGKLLCGLLLQGQWHAWSKISRRELWKIPELKFPVGKYYEDIATMSILGLRTRSFYYEPTPWVAYRQHPESITASFTPRKIEDYSQGLGQFSRQLRATSYIHDPDIQFALANRTAQTLISAMGFLSRLTLIEPSDRVALVHTLGQHFMAHSPLDPQALSRAYLVRFWWKRRSRFLRCWQEIEHS